MAKFSTMHSFLCSFPLYLLRDLFRDTLGSVQYSVSEFDGTFASHSDNSQALLLAAVEESRAGHHQGPKKLNCLSACRGAHQPLRHTGTLFFLRDF